MQWTGNLRVHFVFEVLGYLAGVAVYATTRTRTGDALSDRERASVLVGAALGAAIGTRLLFVLCDLSRLTDPASWFGGKTVVGGLLGGLIGVELAKRVTGISRSSGDLFVNPLIVAMCIGRVGCFLAGPIDKTAGLPTMLPWGIAIGDSVRRHPVALYEIAFLLLLAIGLRSRARISQSNETSALVSGFWFLVLPLREGDRFRLFLAAYLLFRFVVDFLKPEPPPLALGLSAIQWACAAGLLYYGLVFSNADRNASLPFLRRRGVDLHDVLPQD
jgi:prolipoprotein diacylglyceryltransferase